MLDGYANFIAGAVPNLSDENDDLEEARKALTNSDAVRERCEAIDAALPSWF